MGKHCKDCAVFNVGQIYWRNKLKAGENAEGQCRRHAPIAHSGTIRDFPIVYSDDVACADIIEAEGADNA